MPLGFVLSAAELCVEMSLVADSPSHSSSSSGSGGDLEALIFAELDAASSDGSPADDHTDSSDDEDDDDDDDVFEPRRKRRKVEVVEVLEERQDSMVVGRTQERQESTIAGRTQENIGTSKSTFEDRCPPHPASYKGLCTRCGQLVEDDALGVSFGYIREDLRLGSSEIKRLRESNRKDLLRDKKLILILDLDHTLLHSTKISDLSSKEGYLFQLADSTKDDPNRSLFKVDHIHMMTKLRPFVRTFLQEASSIFELYVYTMGEKSYAHEMAKLIDPEKVYFNSKVISHDDSTIRHQKGLDVVLGEEQFTVILDDTECVWNKHAENLILMERYYYFPQTGFHGKSLCELMKDESESEGALVTILKVLKQAHQMFFDQDDADFSSKDVRQVLKTIRNEILQGCKIVFSRVFPSNSAAADQPIWKTAEQLGAICCTEIDSSVTHVVSLDKGTQKAHWASHNGKFLVSPRWIEAANYLWRRPREEDFQVQAMH